MPSEPPVDRWGRSLDEGWARFDAELLIGWGRDGSPSPFVVDAAEALVEGWGAKAAAILIERAASDELVRKVIAGCMFDDSVPEELVQRLEQASRG